MRKKELNFEVNIIPILDILSVMICFLLLTAVWTQVQTMDVKQAVGDNVLSGDKNPPSLWAILGAKGEVKLSLRDVPGSKTNEYSIAGRTLETTTSPRPGATLDPAENNVNWDQVKTKLAEIKQNVPQINVGLVMPKAKSSYGNIIKMLDEMRALQINDVGVAPL